MIVPKAIAVSKHLHIALLIFVLASCEDLRKESPGFRLIETENYQLIKPKSGVEEVLVLFGGFTEGIEDVKREFRIGDLAKRNGVSVLYMSYNQKLWLQESEKQKLADQLQRIFEDHEIPGSRIFIGGFSSGGNIAILISSYLVQKNSEYAPKGVFVIDSPIDLVALYRSSEKNIQRNFSEPSVRESSWIIQTLDENFGNPDTAISNYEKYSVYTEATKNFDNIKSLRTVKIRFYSEPDTNWWKENRMADFDQMNAYYLERLSKHLKDAGFKDVEYIASENKGYRANGDRHPHSWSIVEKENLIEWIRD